MTTKRQRSSNPSRSAASGRTSGSAAGIDSSNTATNANTNQHPSNNETSNENKTLQTGIMVAKAMKGTKLEPLSEHVESLPKQLAMVIEKQANSMLELTLEIMQRTTAVQRFETQVTNPKTKAQEPFAPSCCRLKNPMSASRLLQGEDAYKTIVSDYDELIAKFKTDARNLLLKSAELEVSTREALLSAKVLESLNRLAANISAQEFVRNQFQTPQVNYTLTETEIAYQAANEYIGSVSKNTVNQWKFTSNEKADEEHTKICQREGIHLATFVDRAEAQDLTLVIVIKTKLKELFPKMSTDLWEYHQEKEMIRKINAAQAVLNQKKSQQQANENTAMDLDQPEQTTYTNQTIDPKLQNAIEKLMDQRLKQEKSKQRKNSSADAKNQASRATNNGHESNKNSTRGHDRSNTKSSNKNKQKNQERSRSRGRSRERSRERNRNTSRDKTRNNSPHPSSLRNGR